MPLKLFPGSKRRQSKGAKQRYERLMVIAREHPDKIFDLSECELSTIPQSLYSQCKIFITESLILHSNFFKNLNGGSPYSDLRTIRVLDVHNNLLKSLPKEIGELKNLQVLNVSNNQLSELPASIGDLINLQTLLAKDNKLNSLPDSVKGLQSLRTLDISGTNEIVYLPKSFCHVRNLEVLVISNPKVMEYPASWICEEGLEAIQKFICKDCGLDYVPPSHGVLQVLSPVPIKSEATKSHLAAAFNQETIIDRYRNTQEQKRLQQIEFERQLAHDQEEQVRLASAMLNNKQKTEKLLKQDMDQFEKSIMYQHEKGEKERQKMLHQLNAVEQNASSVVKKLLDASARGKRWRGSIVGKRSLNSRIYSRTTVVFLAKKQEQLMEKMEQERIEQENYFRVTQADIDTLRKKETLAAMESILTDNVQYSAMVDKYLREQSESARQAFELMDNDDNMIRQEVQKQQMQKGFLVSQVLQEEQFQREAFIVLQMERDRVQIRINQQIGELEHELVKLTQIEAERNKFKDIQDKESLSKLRNDLSDLLVILLKEKEGREEQLRLRLAEMEAHKEDDIIDFWLVQYQRLLDSKPEVLVQKEDGLDREIIDLLGKVGALHHASSFARHKVTTYNIQDLNEASLRQIGVHEMGLVKDIMREIENFVARKKKIDLPGDEELAPAIPVTVYSHQPEEEPTAIESTAPPEDEVGTSELPTAPEEDGGGDAELAENECVVCLDKQSNCVLLPCGHVCTCYGCSGPLRQCPMCRTDITQKIRIYRS